MTKLLILLLFLELTVLFVKEQEISLVGDSSSSALDDSKVENQGAKLIFVGHCLWPREEELYHPCLPWSSESYILCCLTYQWMYMVSVKLFGITQDWVTPNFLSGFCILKELVNENLRHAYACKWIPVKYNLIQYLTVH